MPLSDKRVETGYCDNCARISFIGRLRSTRTASPSPALRKKETTVAQLIAKANDGIIGKKVGWEGNFNDMALKTVIRRLLSKYGYLSVEMQNAMAHDVEDEAMSNRNDALDNAAAQTVDLSATE